MEFSQGEEIDTSASNRVIKSIRARSHPANEMTQAQAQAPAPIQNQVDELLSQLEADARSNASTPEPIEITDQVKERMISLMENYLQTRDKLAKVNSLRKELMTQSATITKDLETLMRLYGLKEIFRGNNKFVLDQTVRKKPLKKDEFREVISMVVENPAIVERIYQTAEQTCPSVLIEKVKCLKYKPTRQDQTQN